MATNTRGMRMKLNFWQWLGVVLLIVGVVLWVNREREERAAKEAAQPSPTFTEAMRSAATEPTTEAATQESSAPTTAPG